MECIFYGNSDGAFYKYDDISKCRKINNAYYPLEMYEKRGVNVPELAPQERRILSIDVALMATKKHNNDATAIFINVAIPDGAIYKSNFIYAETFEGLTTDELGLIVMRYFYQYKCTDIVLDCQGVGLGVYDFIIKEQYDPQTGDTYAPLNACNSDEMAERCKIKGANKCVWCIKANADFNSYAATLLRSGIQNGNINLLKNEFDAEEILKKVPGYSKMATADQVKLLMPYVQTSMLVNEMINLEHEIVNNKVKIKEKTGMRKDRFSSVEYNYYVTQILSNKLKTKTADQSILDILTMRPAKRRGRMI